MKKLIKWIGRALCILVSSGVVAHYNATPETLEPLPVVDAVTAREFGQLMPIGLSPDGKLLAYTVRNTQRSRKVDRETWARSGVRDVFTGTDISILNIETGISRVLTGNKDDNFMPVWSPDSRYLAFLSDRDGSGQLKLWIWDPKQDAMKKVSDLSVRQFGWFEWTADARSVVVPVVPENLSIESYVRRFASNVESQDQTSDAIVPRSTVMVYQSSARATPAEEAKSDPWNLDLHLRDLASIDIATGRVTMVVRGRRIASFFLSPDGLRVAYTVPKRFEKPGSQQILFDLITELLPTGEEQTVASDLRLRYDGSSFSWAPDGKHIGYCTGGPAEGIRDCYVANADGRNLRNVSTLPPIPAGDSRAPLWDAKSENIYFIRNGKLWGSSLARTNAVPLGQIPDRAIAQLIPQSHSLLWTRNDGTSTIVLTHDDAGKQDGFYRIDLSSGQSTKLLEDGKCYSCVNSDQQLTVTADGGAVVYFSEDAQHDKDLWISDSTFRDSRRLTYLNRQFDLHRMGSARLVEWLSEDGQSLHGALLLPSAYQEGKRYPLIVWVYGGSLESNHFDHFGLEGSGPFNLQLFATRGYAILVPDAPQQLGTPMSDLAKTVLPGVNKIIEIGIADPDRLGLMGHSYGGYSTVSLIVQTTRFKAAVEADGTADLIGAYGQMDKNGTTYGTAIMEQGQGLMGGTPWEFRTRYIENSPFFYLDRVETPLMIVHGSDDTAVGSFLGDELFVGLRRLGKEVQYAKYEGEDHSPSYWTIKDQEDFCNRMIDWFNRYLHPTDARSVGGTDESRRLP